MKITYLLISHLQTLSVEGIYSWGLDSLSAPMGTIWTRYGIVSGMVLVIECLSVVSRYMCRKQVVL